LNVREATASAVFRAPLVDIGRITPLSLRELAWLITGRIAGASSSVKLGEGAVFPSLLALGCELAGAGVIIPHLATRVLTTFFVSSHSLALLLRRYSPTNNSGKGAVALVVSHPVTCTSAQSITTKELFVDNERIVGTVPCFH